MKRILVVNLNRLGDVVQCSACLTALRRRYPDASITLLIRDESAWAARQLGGVDEIVRWNVAELRAVVVDGAASWAERSAALDRWLADPKVFRPDLAINLTHDALAAVLIALLDPKVVLGERMFASGARHIGGLALRYMHELVRFRDRNAFNIVDLYRMAVGPGSGGAPLALCGGDGAAGRAWLAARQIDPEAPLYGLQPGASLPEKSWPAARFVQAARSIAAADERAIVLLFGAPSERPLIEPIVAAAACARIHAAITSLDELRDLLGRCRTLITNDTAPMHIAAAVGTPAVLVSLGPTNYVETGPFLPGAVALSPRIDCFPCRPSRTCPSRSCHELIDAGLVARVALALGTGVSLAETLTSLEPSLLATANVHEMRRLGSGNIVPVPLVRRRARAQDVERAAYLALWSTVLVEDGDAELGSAALDEYARSYGPLEPRARLELDATERGIGDLCDMLAQGERIAGELCTGLAPEGSAAGAAESSDGAALGVLAAQLAERFSQIERLGRATAGLFPLCRMVKATLDGAAPDEVGADLPRECERIFREARIWAKIFAGALQRARRLFETNSEG